MVDFQLCVVVLALTKTVRDFLLGDRYRWLHITYPLISKDYMYSSVLTTDKGKRRKNLKNAQYFHPYYCSLQSEWYVNPMLWEGYFRCSEQDQDKLDVAFHKNINFLIQVNIHVLSIHHFYDMRQIQSYISLFCINVYCILSLWRRYLPVVQYKSLLKVSRPVTSF